MLMSHGSSIPYRFKILRFGNRFLTTSGNNSIYFIGERLGGLGRALTRTGQIDGSREEHDFSLSVTTKLSPKKWNMIARNSREAA
jgi:hypothetical protein